MKYSLREILLTIAIVGLALGWWLDRRSGSTRFEMHVTGNHAFVLDTVTGQVWNARVHPDQGFLDLSNNNDFKDVKLSE